MMTRDLLRIRGLKTRFFTDSGQVNAADGIDATVRAGEAFGLVGESGSGKSVTARSIMDLIESPGRVTAGEVWYRYPALADEVRDDPEIGVDGDFVDLRTLPKKTLRSLRGTHFSMIFQDPMSSFNPSLTVGEQVAEAVEVQRRATANPRSTRARTVNYSLANFALGTVMASKRFITSDSRDRAVELLELVGIPDPAKRAEEYPHEYSGGMLQRAMIAQALAGEPTILIADEPTTALDVTIQAQILDLLAELQRDRDMAILLITHNLGVIARMCDRVGVMYAGRIVEQGRLEHIFEEPIHPYTQGLLNSVPDLDQARGRLEPIAGNVPSLLAHEMAAGCPFADRCPEAMDRCLEHPPTYVMDEAGDRRVDCYLAEGDEISIIPSEDGGDEA